MFKIAITTWYLSSQLAILLNELLIEPCLTSGYLPRSTQHYYLKDYVFFGQIVYFNSPLSACSANNIVVRFWSYASDLNNKITRKRRTRVYLRKLRCPYVYCVTVECPYVYCVTVELRVQILAFQTRL